MADLSIIILPDGSSYNLKDSSAIHTGDSTTLQGYGITDAYTKSEVNAMVAATYKAGGSIAFANLPALSSTYHGYVYNITDSFTTTSDFVEGSGKEYPAGTNVAIVVLSDGTTYKYDVLSGFIDLSGYERKAIISAVEPTTVSEQIWLCDY